MRPVLARWEVQEILYEAVLACRFFVCLSGCPPQIAPFTDVRRTTLPRSSAPSDAIKPGHHAVLYLGPTSEST